MQQSDKIQNKTGRQFIYDNTALQSPPHVPQIQLHLADEAHDLWYKTQEQLETIGLPPPFWAFAWAGGQALARFVLDHNACVKNKYVLDFASGSGMVAIAAHMAGAHSIEACDIDPFALLAMDMNAKANKADFSIIADNLIGQDHGWDVVLAGDVFYDQAFAAEILPWFTRLHQRGCHILVGDPGRAYLPKTGLTLLETYRVPVSRSLEDSEIKKTHIWEFSPL